MTDGQSVYNKNQLDNAFNDYVKYYSRTNKEEIKLTKNGGVKTYTITYEVQTQNILISVISTNATAWSYVGILANSKINNVLTPLVTSLHIKVTYSDNVITIMNDDVNYDCYATVKIIML